MLGSSRALFSCTIMPVGVVTVGAAAARRPPVARAKRTAIVGLPPRSPAPSADRGLQVRMFCIGSVLAAAHWRQCARRRGASQQPQPPRAASWCKLGPSQSGVLMIRSVGSVRPIIAAMSVPTVTGAPLSIRPQIADRNDGRGGAASPRRKPPAAHAVVARSRTHALRLWFTIVYRYSGAPVRLAEIFKKLWVRRVQRAEAAEAAPQHLDARRLGQAPRRKAGCKPLRRARAANLRQQAVKDDARGARTARLHDGVDALVGGELVACAVVRALDMAPLIVLLQA